MSLIRVFEIPPPGKPQVFANVDCFRDDHMERPINRESWERELRAFIAEKRYAQRWRPLLVLGEHWSFIIEVTRT